MEGLIPILIIFHLITSFITMIALSARDDYELQLNSFAEFIIACFFPIINIIYLFKYGKIITPFVNVFKQIFK